MPQSAARHEPDPREKERELRQAESDNIEDSIENLDEGPPQPLIMVPRPMAYGALYTSVFGAIVGAAIGVGIGALIFDVGANVGFIVIVVVLAFAGLIAGGVAGGWAGSLGEKARDEHRRSYAGQAPGTRPVREGRKPDGDPIGWE